jgi:hypothetical protein
MGVMLAGRNELEDATGNNLNINVEYSIEFGE